MSYKMNNKELLELFSFLPLCNCFETPHFHNNEFVIMIEYVPRVFFCIIKNTQSGKICGIEITGSILNPKNYRPSSSHREFWECYSDGIPVTKEYIQNNSDELKSFILLFSKSMINFYAKNKTLPRFFVGVM